MRNTLVMRSLARTTQPNLVRALGGRAWPEPRAIWPLAAALALLLASGMYWIGVPLIGTRSGWALPVDLGWSAWTRVVSYGLLSALGGAICLARALAALDGRRLGAWWQPRPLERPALAGLAALSLSIPLLFVFQFLIVDWRLVISVADQENDSLLLRLHLGYQLPDQHFPALPFAVGVATLGQRLTLLANVAGPGLLLPIAGGLLCLCGAYLAPRRAVVLSQPTEQNELATPRSGWRRALWLVAGLAALAILGRAPLGLAFAGWGQQALATGDDSAALNRLALAVAFDPDLDDSPGFHQARGEALTASGQKASRDAVLYQAAQYRAAGLDQAAWQEDTLLSAQFPGDALVRRDMVVTLEHLAEDASGGVLLPPDPEAQALDPASVLRAQTTDGPLPWLDRLLQIAPDSVYAHFVRGRIHVTDHSYELGVGDFHAVIAHDHDRDMLSATYTYLAFCYGGRGDYATERALLRRAVELDDGYYNTRAREAASGLH
jgi:tetratricopeptide (TPR) repeat protein